MNENPAITSRKYQQWRGRNTKALLSLQREFCTDAVSELFFFFPQFARPFSITVLTGWFALNSHLEQVCDLDGLVQVSQETMEKLPLNIFILANIFRARKRSFYSCQLTKHSFYPSLLGNLLIRPSLERIVDSLWAAGSFT